MRKVMQKNKMLSSLDFQAFVRSISDIFVIVLSFVVSNCSCYCTSSKISCIRWPSFERRQFLSPCWCGEGYQETVDHAQNHA